MIHKNDPRQNRLFAPFDGLITETGLKILQNGWQGAFRTNFLEKMPVKALAKKFSKHFGVHTKTT